MKNIAAPILVSALIAFSCSGNRGHTSALRNFTNCDELKSYLSQAFTPQENQNGTLSVSQPTYSTTNNVEKDASEAGTGLEEGDIVKAVDNRLISIKGFKINVFNIADPENIRLETSLDLSNEAVTPAETIVTKTRLIVIGKTSDYESYNQDSTHKPDEPSFQTKVFVVNISDPKEPVITKRLSLTSEYSESRISADGNRLIIVSSITTNGWEYSKRRSDTLIDASLGLIRENKTAKTSPLCECQAVAYLDEQRPYRSDVITTSHVHSIDLTTDNPNLKHELSFLGAAPKLRATAEAFLFAFNTNSAGENNSYYSNQPQKGDQTYLALAIDADKKNLKVIAQGTVEGRVSEQFNMEATREIIHVFTSINDGNHIAPTGNRLTTLKVSSPDLTVINRIDGIGKDEFLFSTVFADKMAFAVTFKKTDPFFVIDLSNPLEPLLRGELKITGHTRQLKMLAPDTILAIGREADDQGEFALYDEVHVSLYGIDSDQNPYLIQRELFGSRESRCDAAGTGWWSIGDQGYKSYLYDAKEERLLLPMEIKGTASIHLLKLSDSSITLEGLVTHTSYIDRVLRVGDYYFAISESEISSHAISNPLVTVGALSISN